RSALRPTGAPSGLSLARLVMTGKTRLASGLTDSTDPLPPALPVFSTLRGEVIHTVRTGGGARALMSTASRPAGPDQSAASQPGKSPRSQSITRPTPPPRDGLGV